MHFSFIAKAVPNFSHWSVSLQTEVEKMQMGHICWNGFDSLTVVTLNSTLG